MPVQHAASTVVFGDYNCPFCFALHEQLIQNNCLNLVDWRLIQHAPEISSDVSSISDQMELTNEVATVLHRAPEITISLPPVRPNTELVTRLTAILSKIDIEQMVLFRTQVYRALWQEGLDISDPELIQSLLLQTASGAAVLSDPPAPAQESWQQQWQYGDYDLRIPVIQQPKTQPLVGLSPISDTLNYLLSSTPQSNHEVASCCFKPRPLAVMAGSLKDHWQIFKVLRESYDLRVVADDEQFIELQKGPEQADILFLDGSPDSTINQNCLVQIQQNGWQHLSTVFIAPRYNPEEEQYCLEKGFADYLYPELNPVVLLARIKRLADLKRQIDLLHHNSNRDHLTQLFNRREFEHSLELEWLRAVRSKRPLSLMMIDIDLFKQFNDTYGHLAGDDCLRTTAKNLMKSVIRPADKAFRYGGEEFAVLLPETDLAGALHVAHRIQDSMQASCCSCSTTNEGPLTLSIGIATLPLITDQTPDMALHQADLQLLKAKADGRNQVCSIILN